MKRIQRMLVYVDDLGALKSVLDQIIHVAESSGAKVTFAGVVEPDIWWMATTRGPDPETCATALAQELEAGISETIANLKHSGIVAEVRIFTGEPTKVFIRAVDKGEYDILIKAAQKTTRRSIGSIDHRLLRYISCPVALLQPKKPHSNGRVLATVDFDPHEPEKGAVNDEILDAAVRAAVSVYREIYILHVWQLFGESFLSSPRFELSQTELQDLLEDERKLHENWLKTYVENFFAKLGPETTDFVKPRTLLVKGMPRKTIPKQVAMLEPDLLVLGSVGRSGIAGLFIGNTAESVVSEVDCSILVVKPAGFGAPVVD
jgi:nucleotide-binding universal stress UspA family protein